MRQVLHLRQPSSRHKPSHAYGDLYTNLTVNVPVQGGVHWTNVDTVAETVTLPDSYSYRRSWMINLAVWESSPMADSSIK